MSKYSEIVALLEYVDKAKSGKREKERFNPMKSDPFEELVKFQRMVDEWNKWKKDQEKIHKEEKKEEKHGWERLSFIQKVAILTFTAPLMTMTMGVMFIGFIKISATLLGMR